jgi:ATP-binding cassette, subfamily B, multidrug efflux pump
MGVLSALAIAGLLWAGTWGAAVSMEISIGALTAFVLLYQRFFAPIMTLSNDRQMVQSALSGLERMFQVLAVPPQEVPIRAVRPVVRRSAVVELAHVWYGYVPGQPVLQDISLTVQPGEHVALVGRTGAGKSSVFHLIGGLYSPWSGTVQLAGCDPCTLPAAERRRLLGVVPQMVQLFSGTVLENVTLSDPSLSRAALRHDRPSGERAVVTVVHRLATAREADRVVVIDAGRIVETGSPDELLRRHGRFAALVEIEAAGWDWRMWRG